MIKTKKNVMSADSVSTWRERIEKTGRYIATAGSGSGQHGDGYGSSLYWWTDDLYLVSDGGLILVHHCGGGLACKQPRYISHDDATEWLTTEATKIDGYNHTIDEARAALAQVDGWTQT